jgi:cobaltochelatase CobN
MHLLASTSASIDDLVEAVDLRQSPGDIVILSFADSDLSGLAAAWAAQRDALPTVRLANLRDLRHPLSVDLWLDTVGRHAKVVVVRLLGGLDWWRYGIERLSSLARESSIALAVLPGEDRDDPRLAEASTLPAHELNTLLRFFREGGEENLGALLQRLARHSGARVEAPEPRPVPRTGGYIPGEGAVDLDRLVAFCQRGRPCVPIIFYRAMLLAADTAPIDALCRALAERGLAPAPLVVPSLKDRAAADLVRAALARLKPAVIVTATAFAATAAGGEPTPFDETDVPVLQAVIATTRRSAWSQSPRGLGPADLAMHVVLPELDGRVLQGVIAFKGPLPAQDDLCFGAFGSLPEADRIAILADRIAALIKLQATPRSERRVAVLLPDYPGAADRAGYAVGLDVPASIVGLLSDMEAVNYGVAGAPTTSRALLDALLEPSNDAALPLDRYRDLVATLPDEAIAHVQAAWSDAGNDSNVRDGAFRFRARTFGNILIAFPPDRGRSTDRRVDYHDASLPPRHALLAFGLWLRHVAKVDALVHMGAHGTLEWLPGKAVAMTGSCFPELMVGCLPVIYPFIVSNPGEAAQAKRRIAAVTIGHLPPPLIDAGLAGDARELERLVDEYAQADGLDRRRRERLARLILEQAERSGLAVEARVQPDDTPDDALRRIDAWLCDLKDLAVKDGLHVYGREPVNVGDPAWRASAEAERVAILAALDVRRIAPGPAGSPARGRRDVLPTGRNMFAADPRTLPTPTATDLGRLAADEVIRAYTQAHGEMPRASVVDLWGSATLRTGGEEIAQGLALMGCRPTWDQATGRVTGVEVLPTASAGRPRVDVTWRISGLFRDLFPAQIALIDAAVRAVAAREEAADENPLAAACRVSSAHAGASIARVFGTAPGAYGAGVEDLLGRDIDREQLASAYLAAVSHAYGGAEGDAALAPGAFQARVATADLLVHCAEDPARDLLEGSEDVAFVGGFAAAAATLGRAPDLIILDTTDPARPRARSLSAALARIVRSRAANPKFIAGQLRHGPRGAAELAETVDRLVDFAETTGAVASHFFDLLHDAYVADDGVRSFLLRENSAAAAAIAARLDAARRRGLWHPRRNDVDASLRMLTKGAAP